MSGSNEKGDLSFVMQYGCELSPEESAPVVAMYISECAHESFVEYEVPINSPTQKIAVTIPNTAHLLAATGPDEWPKHTKLVFYATCARKNEQGTKCRVDAGFGSVNLADLLSPVTAFPGGGSVTVPLCLNTCNDYEKGRIRLFFSKIETIDTKRQLAGKHIGRPVRLPSLHSRAQGLYDHLPLRNRLTYKDSSEQESGDAESAAYIKNIMALEMAMPNTDKETGNVRVPIYYGDPGMTRRVPLPAAAYMLFRTPRSNLRFWTNTAEVCLSRDGRNVHDVMNRLRMDLTQRARLMVEICCALVQSLDYIGDVFDMNKRFTQRVEGFLAGSPDVVFNPSYVKGKSPPRF